MKRHITRLTLAVLVVALTALAARVWTVKYDANPDPGARFTVSGSLVRKDRDYRWVEVHLKKSGQAAHDLRKPVRLVTASGTHHEPADITFAGSPETGFTDIWLKFWLAEADLEGALALRINDGELRVKTNAGAPDLGSDGQKVFKNADWGKSWLGF